MNAWRFALVLVAVVVAASAGCGSDSDRNGPPATGTTTGTTTGTGAGTATGGGTATGAGTSSGADACDPRASFTPEQRFRATCRLMVEHPDWGQCASDPPADEAVDLCETDEICQGCPYLWWPETVYGSLVDCLAEVAFMRCCSLEQSAPFVCEADLSIPNPVYQATSCATVWEPLATCSAQE